MIRAQCRHALRRWLSAAQLLRRERKILVDLAEMAMDEFELRRLAAVDPLTGVLSRRAFTEQAKDALALAKRLGHDLSLIVLDLDHFKRVNDSHGHAAGDKVLAATIDACLSTLRSTDAIGRLGGEEFGVLLRRTHRRVRWRWRKSCGAPSAGCRSISARAASP